jgi:hypothetical protein
LFHGCLTRNETAIPQIAAGFSLRPFFAHADVRELIARYSAEAERVVEFKIDAQTGVRSDYRPPKREHRTANETELGPFAVHYAWRVGHESSLQISLRY